ncbi:MAG TPA: caspase family protein [Methylomirabilota bacterium]|nr:caspase family protein [Methylomirabilota bacterium]
MRRPARRAALVAALLALVALPLVAAAQKPRAERPAFAVGDSWALTDATYRLARTDRNGFVFTADDREIWLSRDLTLRYVRRGAESIEVEPPPGPGWPLEVGRRGAGLVIVRLRGADSGEVEVYGTWRVVAAEDVEIAGRKVPAFRIHYGFEPEIPGRFSGNPYQRYGAIAAAARFEYTVWYAPAVQRLVKAVSSKPLLNFELAGEPPVTVQAPAAPPATRPPVPPPSSRAEPPAAARPEAAKPEAAPPARPAPGGARPSTAALAVSVSSPTDQARVDRDTIPLAGLVTSGRGVARVVVTLNGAEVTVVDERAPRPAVSLSASLKLREGANLLVVAATDADGAIRQELRTIHYDRAAPLTIAVRHPADGARVREEQTVVAAVVTSSRGVGSVTVTLNGTEVLRQAESRPQLSVVVTAPVTLREGANTIVLTAREPDGGIRQEVRTVTLDRGATVAAPAPPAPVSRTGYAVIVGVGRYESASIPSLRYSVADAEAMYKVLVDSGGFRKENVLLLTDRSDRRPTLRNLKYALGTFLARAAGKDDTVLVFFAGHGAPEVDPRGIERDGLAKYLIPSDADPDDLFSTALPMDDLQTIFGRIEAERVVVFLDACYSGAAGGRTFAARKTRATAVDDLFLERLTRSRGRAIITASRAAEVSVELPELGHGIFTYYLTEGLRGAADLNRDGIVSLQELYEYVEQQVVRKSRAVGGNQHPMMKGELEGVLPLTKVRAR